eukprot:m51a1_g1861 putative phosphatidylinositol 3-kinase (838) ;mRNA; r:628565-632039
MSLSYFCASDIALPVRIKICSLEGVEGRRRRDAMAPNLDQPFLQNARLYGGPFSDIYVTVELQCDGRPLLPSVERTSHRAFTSQCKWDEYVVLPIKYRDLPLGAYLVFTVWDVAGPREALALGAASVSLFGRHRTLRKGRQKLVLSEGCSALPSALKRDAGKVPVSSEVERLEKLTKRYGRGELDHVDWLDAFTFAKIERVKKNYESESEDSMSLFVELPVFACPVVYREMTYARAKQEVKLTRSATLTAPVPGGATPGAEDNLCAFRDPELDMENPVEAKYLKLARHRMANVLNKDLKPNHKELRYISAILKYSPMKVLTFEEKEMLWKFAPYLTKNKKALTKFLKCVDWGDSEEAKQAVTFVSSWEPVDTEDALALLSSQYPNEQVKKYAVGRLRFAPDESLSDSAHAAIARSSQELLAYLLQLVQAMRYEATSSERHLCKFIIERAVKNPILGSNLFWYLKVEAEDNQFYAAMLSDYMQARSPEDSESSHRQMKLLADMIKMQDALRGMNVARPKKIDKMAQMVSPKGEFESLYSFAPTPFFLEPSVYVKGVVPEEGTIFKSALAPLGLTFRTTEDAKYQIILKSGDDMRQDQLIIQMILLMDTLLKKENLDLKLTPYRVLATSSTSGMVQRINSQSIDHVIKDGDIQKFFRQYHADPSGPYGISPDVIDTFVKSCAGYCVITHILGIGDRHLDNLMLTPDGNMFHIDFGFILGNENKPFPPPMKLCKEMVTAMGGPQSPHYNQFRQYCCETYNILRKHANMILTLFMLMVDSKIRDIAYDPNKALLQLQDKFRMELTDEEAQQTLLILINESVGALFPALVDSVHRFLQYWRS